MPKLGLGFQAMDSPETAKLTTCSASDSPPVQDSPFFNFISNLSPITHVRSTHATRELSRLNSPPIVFKSPRRKQHSETNILKRSYSLQLSSPLEPQSINRGKECIDGPVDTEQFISQNGLIAETLKGCDVAGSSETHPSSSSGCVDEFLADPGEADSVSSAKSATPTLKQSNDACASYRSGSRESKETIFKFDNKNGMWMDTEANLEALLVSSENADKDIQGSESGAKSTEIEEEQKDAEWPSYTCQNITTSFPVVASFNKQSRQNLESQGIEFEHHNDRECASQPSPDRFPAQTYEDHSEDGDGISEGPVENIMRKGHKASENQRGVRRRCLQFEEAPSCTIRYGDSSSNLASTVSSSKQPTSSNLGAFKSSHAESKVTSETMINLPQSAPTLSHTRSCENISMASKPLGIGLHLNSIVNAVSLGCTTTAGKKSTDHHMGVGGIKSRMPENTKSCFVSLSVIEKDSASNEERIDSAKPLSLASSVTNQFSHMVEDLYPALDENGKSKPQNADRFEENDQPSPRKKRKKATSLGDDGCKRCNCKKTKCLKLYCDCFAAGVYCTDPCACQGCFNRPEYKDTVLETRGQIESRNPLAFAPKIVQRISELPPNNGEDGNRSTPSSARHKRGCNCKRSMCLKKYCECYQANVGCSSGCRCEGCKNVFGKKEEYVAMELGVTREIVGDIACEEQLETTFDKELEMAELRRDLLCTELIIPHNLTPLTPSFQHSDHGKNAPKSRLLSKRHLPSPDSNHSVLSSYNKPMKSPPGDVENGGILLKTCEALQNEGSHDMQADYNMGKSGSISSRCNVVSNAHYSTEMSDPPIPIILQRRRDCVSVSQSQQCPENDFLFSRSLTRHGSPLTPMTRLGGTKPNQGPDSACELIDILEGDGTPVKVSSPNKKRVSPPHSRIYKLGSGSSVGLRSGRKFILKSVPSFPPLTPCIDSKGSSISQNRDKLQDNDSVKEQDNDSIKK